MPPYYSWIANQRDTHKNQFASEPEGLRQFQDHRWKTFDKENSDLPGLFVCNHFLASYYLTGLLLLADISASTAATRLTSRNSENLLTVGRQFGFG